MVKLDGRKQRGMIVISEDSFEHLLNCLDNQKFVTVPEKQTPFEKKEIQTPIDNFNKQCRNLWLRRTHEVPYNWI